MRVLTGIAAAVVLAIGGAAYGVAGYTEVDPGYRGLLFKQLGSNRGMQKEQLRPGTTWVDPILYDVIKYDTRAKQFDIIDMPANTADGQPILIDFSVEVSLKGENLPELHDKVGRDYYNQIIYPKLRSSLRNEAAKVRSDDIYTGKGRLVIQKNLQEIMQAKLDEIGIIILVNLRDIQFTNRDFVATLEAKAIAGQQEEIKRREAAAAEQEAIRVANIAEGQKQKRIKEAEAGAEELRQQGIGQRAQKEENAKGILAVGQAEAEVTRLKNEAMDGPGGDKIVSIAWAENLGPNVKVYGVPTGAPGTASMMDLNGMLGGAFKGMAPGGAK